MADSGDWLALAMQLPSQPAYARVKMWRRLRDAGAISIAGGIHLLPNEPRHRSMFDAALHDAIACGGQATILSGQVIAGSEEPLALFRSARTADYETWIADAGRLMAADVKAADVVRLRRRLDRIRSIDYFESDGFARADETMRALVEASYRHPSVARADPGSAFRVKQLHGRIWVTRRQMGIDRIASAWLIRRFIDPRPRFRFVDPDRYTHQKRELRFDMADGEFTHEGDNCSFETLLRHTDIAADHGLEEIARIIHQLDIEDGLYDHRRAADFAAAIARICSDCERDEERLDAGSEVLDDLHSQLGVAR